MDKGYHLAAQSIHDGFRIYEERLSVMGVFMRKSDVKAFCKGSNLALQFEPEPSNKHDPNAIRVIGWWDGWFGRKSAMLGYVPAEHAAKLSALGLVDQVRPRLLKTYVGTDDFVEVLFQILGPTEHYKVFNPPRETAETRSKAMIAAGNVAGAETELIAAVDAQEKEAQEKGWGVGARPYKALAQFYRKSKRYADELAILDRFAAQKKAPGRSQEEFVEQLDKARELAAVKLAGQQ